MRRLLLLLALLCAVPSHAQSYPEVEALLDAAFAQDATRVAQFFPLELQRTLQQFSPEDQQEFAKEFLLLEKLGGEGVTITRSEHPPTLIEIRHDTGAQPAEVTRVVLEKRISDGYETLLRLGVEQDGNSRFSTDDKLLVWMRMEEGQWRILEAQPLRETERLSFDNPQIIEEFRLRHSNQNEIAAVSWLRTLNTALATYASTYPGRGFPSGLEGLACSAPNSGTLSHACLLGGPLSAPPFEILGYRFTYYAVRQGGPTRYYTLSARPIEYGSSGKRSFFTDEGGVIHYTEEDRESGVGDVALR